MNFWFKIGKTALQTNSRAVLKIKILPDCLQVPSEPSVKPEGCFGGGEAAASVTVMKLCTPGDLMAVWQDFLGFNFKSALHTNSKDRC